MKKKSKDKGERKKKGRALIRVSRAIIRLNTVIVLWNGNGNE